MPEDDDLTVGEALAIAAILEAHPRKLEHWSRIAAKLRRYAEQLLDHDRQEDH